MSGYRDAPPDRLLADPADSALRPDWGTGAARPYPDIALPGLILAWAARTPDAIAVAQWDRTLTYRSLAVDSGQVAAMLGRLGVGPEHLVGLFLSRTPEVAVAMLGVHRAGGAYVALDPTGPVARSRHMLDDAGVEVVLVDDRTADHPALAGRRQVLVRSPMGGDSELGPTDPGPASATNAAYVLFTSGSSGRPKGTVVTHRSVVEFCTAFADYTGADQRVRSFAFSAFTFDASVVDLILPMTVGGTACLLSESDRTDPDRLQRFAVEHRVSWGWVPPALLPLLDPSELPDWRVLLTGGEAPGPEQVSRWTKASQQTEQVGRLASSPTQLRFINGYGPTETTVFAAVFSADGQWTRPLPIGSPVANHRLYIVDEHLRPVPTGSAGELLIGGPGLARGYLRRPGLTASRFIPDPFSGEPGARLYRTGDLVSVQPSGDLQFLGRNDGQVKIRGQRVEIGEVEAVLGAHPQVGHAVVLALPAAGGRDLIAFCARRSPHSTPEAPAADPDLRPWCEERLPIYMVPSQVMWLDAMPLNVAGKVDQGELSRLAAESAGRLSRLAAEAPADQPAAEGELTGVAITVTSAWQELLGTPTEHLGPDLDFFVAGGHSITAMRLVAALRAALGRRVTVEDVFAGRTLGAIADRASVAEPIDGTELPVGSPPALSAAQVRLWFVDKLAPSASAYNIALAQRLHGWLDRAALNTALTSVLSRHEVLRWYLPEQGGLPSAAVRPTARRPIPVEDLRSLAPDEQEKVLRERLTDLAAAPFPLAEGPLWRVRLLQLADDEHVFAITFHHAIFDGWSQRPFFTELAEGYLNARAGRSLDPAPLPATFADYVAWRAGRDAERTAGDLTWWTAHLAGAPAYLPLPTDRPRPNVQSYPGARVVLPISVATTAAVRELAASLGATAPAVLLAAFGQAMSRLIGATDMIIGVPAADRRHVNFHDLIGFFIDVVPLRLRVDPRAAFTDSVRAVATELLDALAHPAAPLERIVEALGVPRDPARPPLVQVLFNVYNFPESRLELADLAVEHVEPGLAGSPFDLTCYIAERDARFVVEALYNTDLFDRARVQTMFEGYLDLLDRFTVSPSTATGELSSPELAQLGHTGVAAPVTPVPSMPLARPSDQGQLLTPANAPMEELVAGVWRTVLGREHVGAQDNFFDLGGTSLSIVTVATALSELTGRRISIVDLFRFPNIRMLATFLDQPETTTGAGARTGRATQRAAARRDRLQSRSGAPRSNTSMTIVTTTTEPMPSVATTEEEPSK